MGVLGLSLGLSLRLTGQPLNLALLGHMPPTGSPPAAQSWLSHSKPVLPRCYPRHPQGSIMTLLLGQVIAHGTRNPQRCRGHTRYSARCSSVILAMNTQVCRGHRFRVSSTNAPFKLGGSPRHHLQGIQPGQKFLQRPCVDIKPGDCHGCSGVDGHGAWLAQWPALGI
jgi:hypothetical protein